MTTPSLLRDAFTTAHPKVVQLNAADQAGIERYLVDSGIVEPGELPARVEPAAQGT